MTDREILIELLAIKLWEHTPLAGGQQNLTSWIAVDPEDRQTYRQLVEGDREAIYPELE